MKKTLKELNKIRKFQDGQEMFMVEVNANGILPPKLSIEKYTISGFASSVFTRNDGKILYRVKEDDFILAFEDRIYATYEEAHKKLLVMIEDDYSYFIDKYDNLISDLDKWREDYYSEDEKL